MPSRSTVSLLLALSLAPAGGCSRADDEAAPPGGSGAVDASGADDARPDQPGEHDVSIDDAPVADAKDAADAGPDAAVDASTKDATEAAVSPDPHCLPLVQGNDAADASRVNLVLLFAGFDDATSSLDVPRLFSGLVSGTADNAYDFDPTIAPLYAVEGLAGIEPFASNLARFNFWYVDLPLYGPGELCPFLDLPPGTGCAGNVLTTTDKGGGTVSTVLSPEDVLALSQAGHACSLPNRYVNLVYAPTATMSETTFPKPGNYANFGWYSQEVLTFGAGTTIDKVFAAFVHELVHALGQVWDEKGDHLSPADYPAALPGPNCFSLGPAQPLDAQECAARADLPWRDLIGNGCGKDGVVDCPKTRSFYDPNLATYMVDRFDEWLYEVRDDVDGCGPGCAYTQGNVFRPFVGCDVMSSCDLTGETTTGLFTRLGPVSEREVCRRLLSITGAVSAFCDSLCLAGCPVGTRCVQGTCVDVSSIH